MKTYHAVFIDETGCEFGATIKAISKNKAWIKAYDDYPESKCIQLESKADTRKRERLIYERIRREEEGDFREWEYEQEFGY